MKAPKWLHVVDLAASRDGEEADTGPLFACWKHSLTQSVQTGGGVRNRTTCVSRRLDTRRQPRGGRQRLS